MSFRILKSDWHFHPKFLFHTFGKELLKHFVSEIRNCGFWKGKDVRLLVTDNFIHSDMKGSCGPSGPYTWRPSLVLSLPAAVSDSDPARRQPPHLHLVSSLSIPAAGHGGGGAGAAEPGRIPLVGLPRRRLLREARADRRGNLRVGTLPTP
jgi:hypothetical protein